MKNRIKTLEAVDVRFPTSEHLDGSDATNREPDYSAAYIILETEQGDRGFGLLFTIGRGNDLCCEAIKSLQHLVLGYDFNEVQSDFLAFYDFLRSDSQLQWLGPEKGVIHMAVGAIVNAAWDLWARLEEKPVWRLLVDMSPEKFVDLLDFRYVTDAITRDEALEIIYRNESTKLERIRYLETHGYPAYTTSAGWLGYSDEKLQALCEQAVQQGFKHVKLKVGKRVDDDIRRCRIARQAIGDDLHLMIDANQAWDVGEAITWISRLKEFKPWFIEEPTSPDDVLGHAEIRDGISPIGVATGEHCMNRVLFKQYLKHDAVDVVQIDACRLAGLNEILTVYMMAAKFGKPVCPHAGGVGLCEYVQHMSMIDFVRVSGEINGRVIEFVDHLHEHFVSPCVLENGAYQPPTAPGFSVKMKPKSLAEYTYPSGSQWLARRGSKISLAGG